MYRSLFSRDLFSEFDRLQRDLQQAFELSPATQANIRGWSRGSYPGLNVGTTAQSVEVYCFAPGLNPDTLDVQIDKGVLTIAGERQAVVPDSKATLHIEERFAGKFRRVLSLPDDADPQAVNATYRDGVLHISVTRRQAPEPRRITVQ